MKQHLENGSHPTRRSVVKLGAAWAAASFAQTARAGDAYPSRIVSLILGQAAGSSADVLARTLGDALAGIWSRAVVVDNKPGASSLLAISAATHAPADGHTLLLGTTGIVQNASLLANLPYDPIKDLKPVSRVATTALAFCVPTSSPVTSLADFVDRSRAGGPEASAYMSPGASTSQNIYATLLMRQARLKMVPVHYRSESLGLPDFLSGRVPSAFLSSGEAIRLSRSASVRVLAVTGRTRHPLLPDAPTLAELGHPGFELLGWFGMFAPPRTPQAIVTKVAKDIATVLARNEINAKLAEVGFTLGASTPADFEAEVRSDLNAWGKLIKSIDMSPVR